MLSSLDSGSIDVSPEQTQAALADNSAQVVDVREPDEWDAGRIDGAIHIGLQQLGSEAGRIDTDRPVIFYCLSGARSAMAAQAFRGLGLDAHSMAGGIKRWADEGRPLSPQDGVVAGH
jgi:hydroxyacylglutathione hydrolase/adenylyltransferase/sulfurtransferase